MSRSVGLQSRHLWLLHRQLGPKNEEEIEAGLCANELAGIESWRMPFAVLQSRAGMSHLHRVGPVDRRIVLNWFADRGMEHNVARLIRTWGLSALFVKNSRRIASVVAALPRCPGLRVLEVLRAGIGPHEILGLLCAGHVTVLRLHRCWCVAPERGTVGGWLTSGCGSRVTDLTVTGPGAASLTDVVNRLIAISSLQSLKLNLGHDDGQLRALLEALQPQPVLRILAIRLAGADQVKALLAGLVTSSCMASLARLTIHGDHQQAPAGQGASGPDVVSDLVDALVKARGPAAAFRIEFKR